MDPFDEVYTSALRAWAAQHLNVAGDADVGVKISLRAHHRFFVTPGVDAKVKLAHAEACLARHLLGDWGLLDEEDQAVTDHRARNDGQVLSSWPINAEDSNAVGYVDRCFYIITAPDRASTTIVLAEEY